MEQARLVLHAWQRNELFLKYRPAVHVHTHTWDGLALSITLVHLTHFLSEVTVHSWMISSAAHDACVFRVAEAHGVHAENPCPSANDTPVVQAVHAWAPGAEYVPTRQEVQVKDEMAPDTMEYFPARQAVHAAEEMAPVVTRYVPALQAWQVEEVAAPVAPEYVPAGQPTQVEARLAPVAPEYVPGVHDKQVDTKLAPGTREYFPARQEVHTEETLAPTVPE